MEVQENTPHSPKMIEKSFVKMFFPLHMFFLAWKMQFWRPFVKWLNERTEKSFPQIRKIFAQRWNLFQEANNVFVKVFLWTRKMPFWRFCWKVSPKVEKFLLKLHFSRLLKCFRREFNKFCLKNQTKLKNQHVFDKNSWKNSRDA